MNFSRLLSIKKSFKNHNISLKEIKSLWFQAKEIIEKNNSLGQLDLEVSIDIFNLGIIRVDSFCQKWLNDEIKPTDEELDLLEEAFNEASWAFNFLSTNPPYLCSTENNQGWQKKIKENKQIVYEEKSRRNQIKDLQSQINSLQNHSNNDDNKSEINSLRGQIRDLKNKKSNSSIIFSNPQSDHSSLKNNESIDSYSSAEIFFLGLVAGLLIALVVYLVIKAKNKFN